MQSEKYFKYKKQVGFLKCGQNLIFKRISKKILRNNRVPLNEKKNSVF